MQERAIHRANTRKPILKAHHDVLYFTFLNIVSLIIRYIHSTDKPCAELGNRRSRQNGPYSMGLPEY
jgi:hypothetical protein